MAKRREVARLQIDARLCKGTEGCGICIEMCQEQVLGVAASFSSRGVHPAAVVRLEECTGCELCVIHCPDMAVDLALREAGGDG